MDNLLPLRFILFGLAFSGFVYLQFFLAHRQWLRLKGEQATEIDLEYVKMEDCLPKSFRARATTWLQLPSASEADSPDRIIAKGREQVRVTSHMSLGSGESRDEILMVQGDLSCGPQCRLVREIWAKGSAAIGAGSSLQAIAADGPLVLDNGVSVARWADSEQEVRVGDRCRIGSRVTSRKQVHLGLEAQVLSAYAPLVATAGWDGSMNGAGSDGEADLLEIGPPEGPEPAAESLEAAGIEPSRMTKLSPHCWSYFGDFKPWKPIRLAAGIVVKGSCDLPGKSCLSGDVKVHGALQAGPYCSFEGNLVSEGDIHLGRNCRFTGVIHAGGALLMSSGTRGVLKKDLVAAYSSSDLYVERNVAVNGKLASGGKVTVVDSGLAEDWRRRRGMRES